MKKRVVKSYLKLIFIGIIFVAYLVIHYYISQAIQKPITLKRDEAAETDIGVTLFTSPTSISSYKGDSFTVDLDINTQSENVSGVDLVFIYDKNFLQVNSIIPRNFFEKVIKTSTDNDGNVSIILTNNPGVFAKGSGTLVSINFTALSSGTTTLSYSNISQVSSSDRVINVLSSSSGTSIKINDLPSVKSSSDNSNQGSKIIVYASGTEADSQFPILELLIDGKSMAIFYGVSGQEKKYIYNHPVKVQPSQIRLRFTNDYNDRENNEDRNLRVDKIQIDEVKYETEDQSTYSIGTWSEKGCGSGFKKSEWLYCNGEFVFSQ